MIRARTNVEAAFFCSEDELLSLLQDENEDRDFKRIYVALGPSADFAASNRGVPYVTIEDVYDEAELSSSTELTFERVISLCNYLDVHAAVKGEREGLCTFSAGQYFFELKGMHDGVFRGGVAATGVIRKLEPSRIIIFSTGEWERSKSIRLEENFLVRAIAIAAKSSAIKIHMREPLRGNQKNYDVEGNKLRRIRKFGKNFLTKINLVKKRFSFQNGCLRGVRILQNRYWCEEGISLLAQKGATIRTASKILKHRTRLAVEDEKEWVEKGKRAWAGVQIDEKIRSLFRINDTDFFELVEGHLAYFLCEVMPLHMKYFELARVEMRVGHYDILLGAAPVSVDVLPVHAAAQAEGIPTVSIQHGGFYGYADFPNMYFTETYMEDEFLSWGIGVSRLIQKYIPPQNDSPVRVHGNVRTVGSVMLENLRAQLGRGLAQPSQHKRVLYVPTQLNGNYRHLSHILYPDILYSRIQREIIHLCTIHGAELVVKMPANQFESLDILKAICIQNESARCKIDSTKPLKEHLITGQYDFVILDSPTTVLLETLTTTLPVAVLFPRSIMRPLEEALSLLKRRAYVALSFEEHINIISKLLNGELKPGEGIITHDDAFLRYYGLGPEGETAAMRLEVAICDIVEQSKANMKFAASSKGITTIFP